MEKKTLQGRIICSLGGFYRVACPEQVVECRARGVFRKQEVKPMVGDQALIELTEDGKGYVMEILPRKNSLSRPPLANLDQLLLVVSILDPAPNLLVLDKLIAQAEFQGIEPVIVITKADLADTGALEEIYRQAGFNVLVTCSRTGEGTGQVQDALAGKVSAFCGNSGVGKSSLLNAIDPRLCLDTGDISQKLGRGRHTTRHVELYQLENGGYVADTPGFSAVELDGMGESNKTGLNRSKGRSPEQVIRKEQLAECFREFAPFVGQCRFSGCSHTKEAGCAVLEAVRQGQIAPSRHQSYVSLYEQAKTIKDWQLKGK